MGYRLNRLDEPVFMAVSKPLLTEFGIHLRLESCDEHQKEKQISSRVFLRNPSNLNKSPSAQVRRRCFKAWNEPNIRRINDPLNLPPPYTPDKKFVRSCFPPPQPATKYCSRRRGCPSGLLCWYCICNTQEIGVIYGILLLQLWGHEFLSTQNCPCNQ